MLFDCVEGVHGIQCFEVERCVFHPDIFAVDRDACCELRKEEDEKR